MDGACVEVRLEGLGAGLRPPPEELVLHVAKTCSATPLSMQLPFLRRGGSGAVGIIDRLPIRMRLIWCKQVLRTYSAPIVSTMDILRILFIGP